MSKLDGFLCVMGAVGIGLFHGVFYLWGHIGNYVISYFHHQGDLNANNKLGCIIVPLLYFVNNFTSPIGPHFMKTINLKFIMAGGLGLMLGGLFLASYMNTFVAFILTYALLMPIGRGIFFFVPYVCSY